MFIISSLWLRSIVFALMLSLYSCGSSDKKSQYITSSYEDADEVDELEISDTNVVGEEEYPNYDNSEIPDTGYSSTGDIAVPFVEEGGVKYVNVEINGSIGKRMIIDSGCSVTLISVAEANYLAQKGVLTVDDVGGQTSSVIADGSITVNTEVTLRQLVIDDKIFCSDVKAVVSDNVNAPMLLGNEVLNRAGAYTIDNQNSVIIFHNVPLL